MKVPPHTLPDTVAELQQLLIEKLSIIEQHEKTIASSQSLNKVLEEKLRLLNQKLFARSSEKNPGQAELQFLNEAGMLHSQAIQDELESDEEEPEIDVPAHKRKPAKKRELPTGLPRCDVFHDLSDEQKQCACGKTMLAIGEETLEQLAIVPRQFHVIVHHKLKYACTLYLQELHAYGHDAATADSWQPGQPSDNLSRHGVQIP